MRRSRLPLLSLLLAVTVSGCFYDPAMNVGVFAPSELLSERNTPEFAHGPVERSVVLHVPGGALEGAESAVFRIRATTGSPEPFPDVEFAIGDPINEKLVVDSVDQFAENFAMPVPSGCTGGCEFVVPVVITQVGSGQTPAVSWAVTIYFDYEGPGDPPPAADDMRVEILPAEE